MTATEHYGAVLNRPFCYERYLEDAARLGMTITRLFTLFRELQSPINPYSTCKPESTDYLAPFRRVGPGAALDSLPRYDLTQWNDEYFERLHGFLKRAGHYGIIVELTLLSCTYNETIWSLNPLHAQNNVNGLTPTSWQKYTSQRDPMLFDWQCRHVRKIVAETQHYDHVIYEICNEPAGGESSLPDNPTPEEVDAWQTALVELIHELEPGPAQRHLISGQQCAVWPAPGRPDAEIGQPNARAFESLPFDIVNVHPLAMVSLHGKRYDMGLFMSGQLRLEALRDFALDTYDLPKPLDYNEDNAATMFKDEVGWTIHRKRAWTTMLSGAHYDMIDFSIWPHLETGTPASQAKLRAWFSYLSAFLRTVDLARARPQRGMVKSKPAHVVESVLVVAGHPGGPGVPGEDYCIYLADGREREEPDAGEPIQGELRIDLPAGTYELKTLCPVSGQWSEAAPVASDGECLIPLPAFRHDLLVRLRRVGV